MSKATIAYNSTKHSATQFKPFEIINGHLETQDYLELNIAEKLTQNYVENDKQAVNILYDKYKVKQNNVKVKESNLKYFNKNRQDPPLISNEEIYEKTKRRTKNVNPYKKQIIIPELISHSKPKIKIKTIKNKPINKVNIRNVNLESRPSTSKDELIKFVTDA